VELHDVDVLYAEALKALLQILAKDLAVERMALGGQHQPLTPASDGFPDALLTGRVAMGRVDQSHAQVQATPHHADRFFFCQSLDRDTPKTKG